MSDHDAAEESAHGHDTARPGHPLGAALPTATARQARSRVARLLADRRRGVAGVIVVTGVATAARLAGPALIGVVIDAIADPDAGSRSTIDKAAITFMVLALLGSLLQYRAAIMAAIVGESALAELRAEVFDHALDLPIDIVERAGTGELVSRVAGDVTVLARAVRTTAPVVFFAAVELVFTVGALVIVHPLLAGAALAAWVPLGAVGGVWYVRHAPARYRAEREGQARLAGALLQAYEGAPALIAHRAQAGHRSRLALVGRWLVEAELATASARNRLRPAVGMGAACALMVSVVFGAELVERGSMTLGEASTVALYLIRLLDPVGRLLEQIDQVQQSSAALARLVGVALVPGRRPGAGSLVASGRSGSGSDPAIGAAVALRAVTFGYAPGHPALVEVDLTVAPGEHVVIVGPSGAGKTSLAKLLCATHRPWTGSIALAGMAIDDHEPEHLLRTIAMVAQEGHVFARTIADNVRLGRPSASDDDVRAALDAVDALEWVESQAHGIHTVAGDVRRGLTAPEAQQIGLARLVCVDPTIVVLDEATADLDPAAAASVERHLDSVLAGRTVITIAHRLSAAQRADRVVVMDHGRIVAHATHAELLSTNALYRSLWEAWSPSRD